MATNNETKLKRMLDAHRPGTVATAGWLERLGVSRSLQRHYCRSGWLESVGTGAFRRPKDPVSWQGGLYAIQTQSGLPIHAGGLTALQLQGYSHYARSGSEPVYLFSPPKITLPSWYRLCDWGQPIHHRRTSSLPQDMALMTTQGPAGIRMSTPERAILECLYLAPDQFDLVECYQLLEGMATLRPRTLQPLLSGCTSIKVKRLFLYLANKTGHSWNARLDLSSISLGRGERTIVKGGVYVGKYQLTVPRELEAL